MAYTHQERMGSIPLILYYLSLIRPTSRNKLGCALKTTDSFPLILHRRPSLLSGFDLWADMTSEGELWVVRDNVDI
jgi:hypothetical protein